jgi:hypothetical protein
VNQWRQEEEEQQQQRNDGTFGSANTTGIVNDQVTS